MLVKVCLFLKTTIADIFVLISEQELHEKGLTGNEYCHDKPGTAQVGAPLKFQKDKSCKKTNYAKLFHYLGKFIKYRAPKNRAPEGEP